MSDETIDDLAARVEEIRARTTAVGKILHDVINEGIATLENLRELRDQHVALVEDVDQLAAKIAARRGS